MRADRAVITHLMLCLRYQPPTFHVQAWYSEVKDYSYPYPQECNPYCPFRCSGPVCTHYTQVANPRTVPSHHEGGGGGGWDGGEKTQH